MAGRWPPQDPRAAGGIGHPEGQVRCAAGDQFEVEGPGEVGDAIGHPDGDVGGVNTGGFGTHGFVCSGGDGGEGLEKTPVGLAASLRVDGLDTDVARPGVVVGLDAVGDRGLIAPGHHSVEKTRRAVADFVIGETEPLQLLR